MRTRTKLMAGFNTSVLVGGALVLLAGAAPASAHTPEVQATCSELTVALENYTPDAGNAAPNNIIVTLDGEEIASESFGATFNATYSFDDITVGTEWTVEIDAIGSDYDWDDSGVTEACPETEEPPVVVPPTEPPVVVPPTEPPVVVPPTEPPVVVPPTEPPVVVPPTEPPVVVPPTEPPVVVPPTEPPVTTTPPVEPPVTTTPPDVELPPTGADTGWALPLAGALLLGGIALMFVRRARKA